MGKKLCAPTGAKIYTVSTDHFLIFRSCHFLLWLYFCCWILGHGSLVKDLDGDEGKATGQRKTCTVRWRRVFLNILAKLWNFPSVLIQQIWNITKIYIYLLIDTLIRRGWKNLWNKNYLSTPQQKCRWWIWRNIDSDWLSKVWTDCWWCHIPNIGRPHVSGRYVVVHTHLFVFIFLLLLLSWHDMYWDFFVPLMSFPLLPYIFSSLCFPPLLSSYYDGNYRLLSQWDCAWPGM